MIYDGNEYILVESDNGCEGCALMSLCDEMADNMNCIEFALCETEESEDIPDTESFIYQKKEKFE